VPPIKEMCGEISSSLMIQLRIESIIGKLKIHRILFLNLLTVPWSRQFVTDVWDTCTIQYYISYNKSQFLSGN
jgi:hypothetical protein